MTTDGLSRRAEIASLYERYGGLVERRCRYILKDEEAARDATQEVFVKVMGAIDAFRHDASPLTWMLRIATNHCLNVLASRNARWHERYKAYVSHAAEGRSSGSEAMERASSVRRVLGRLDTETAQVAIHYYVDEMTQEEIAAVVGRSLPTIRKRLDKFARVAKKELGRELA